MSYCLVVAEKPSVGAAYAKVLGATNRQDGYWEGNGYLVSWCVGHLVELAPPNVYDAKYVKWSIVIFVIVYGRMIEIYCMVSLAPIPMATFGNHEQSHMGQNYLKCLFALGFQGFLILICVAIYAVLIQSVAISGDAINSIWSIVGYTVLLCFSLFKTSSVTKSVLGAH